MLLSTLNSLWWKFMPGTEIVVKCPNDLVLVPDPFEPNRNLVGTISYLSIDNSRRVLEKTVGIKGWDWDWDMVSYDQLKIKFRLGKTRHASYFLLKWC